MPCRSSGDLQDVPQRLTLSGRPKGKDHKISERERQKQAGKAGRRVCSNKAETPHTQVRLPIPESLFDAHPLGIEVDDLTVGKRAAARYDQIPWFLMTGSVIDNEIDGILLRSVVQHAVSRETSVGSRETAEGNRSALAIDTDVPGSANEKGNACGGKLRQKTHPGVAAIHDEDGSRFDGKAGRDRHEQCVLDNVLALRHIVVDKTGKRDRQDAPFEDKPDKKRRHAADRGLIKDHRQPAVARRANRQRNEQGNHRLWRDIRVVEKTVEARLSRLCRCVQRKAAGQGRL